MIALVGTIVIENWIGWGRGWGQGFKHDTRVFSFGVLIGIVNL